MERVLILGAGPLARIVPDVASACRGVEILGFVRAAGEAPGLVGDAAGFPLYEDSRFPAELRGELGSFSVLVAAEGVEVRRALVARTTGLRFARIVHPTAVVSATAGLGHGVLLAPCVVIGPGAVVGDHVILNSAVTVDHDSVLEDHVVLAPGVHIAGGVRVREGATVGVGAAFIPGVTVGRGSVIGAGSVVTKDVPDRVVAAGVPAKVIRPLA